MSSQPSPRRSSIFASALAAGVMLTVASCSHVTPLGPDPTATMPQLHQLRSPLILEDMRQQPAPVGGGCPAGSVELSGNAAGCYRTTGTSATSVFAGSGVWLCFFIMSSNGEPSKGSTPVSAS